MVSVHQEVQPEDSKLKIQRSSEFFVLANANESAYVCVLDHEVGHLTVDCAMSACNSGEAHSAEECGDSLEKNSNKHEKDL